MRKYLILLLLLGLTIMARGQTGYDYHYWFDSDPAVRHSGHANYGNLQLTLDASQLSDGFHTLSMQVTDSKSLMAQIVSKLFMKVSGMDHIEAFYWFDNEQQHTPSPMAQGTFDIDAKRLTDGFHILHYQVRNSGGRLSQLASRYFVKVVRTGNQEQLVYAIDGGELKKAEGQYANGSYTFELDLNELRDGVHQIAYQLTDGDHLTIPIKTNIFVKGAAGNGIVEYRYWLNEQTGSTQKVKLAERVNPLELVTMLSLPTAPLRSQHFVFDVPDGQPTVYPVHDLHLRFIDVNNNQADTVATYADMSDGQPVTSLTQLQPDVVKTVAKPAANAIKWFKVEGNTGDSLAFRLNHQATIQLFGPTGTELYRADGSDATNWGSALATGNGIYYLALHDGTESATTISIEYHRTKSASKPGDVNGDGSADIGDIVMVISVMTGTETNAAIKAAADVNGDSAVDIGDIVSIIDIMTKQ